MRILTLIFTAFVLQACATGGPYKKGEIVTMNGGGLEGRSFNQDNLPVSGSELVKALKSNPKTKDIIDGVDHMEFGTMVLAAGGGFSFGYGLATLGKDDGGEPVLIAIGAAAIVLAFVLDSAVNKKYYEAIELHNSEIKSSAAPAPAPSKKKSGTGLKILPNGFAWAF